jgi:hypothetical protein
MHDTVSTAVVTSFCEQIISFGVVKQVHRNTDDVMLPHVPNVPIHTTTTISTTTNVHVHTHRCTSVRSLTHTVENSLLRDIALKLDHSRFVPNPLKFFIHLSSYIVQLLRKLHKINYQPQCCHEISSSLGDKCEV